MCITVKTFETSNTQLYTAYLWILFAPFLNLDAAACHAVSARGVSVLFVPQPC